MQAFRAKATVSDDRELHITRVPFPPGAELDIILLEEESRDSKSGETTPSPVEVPQPRDTVAEPGRPDTQRLVQDQYRLAEQYPGEYVVLVATRIVHHSPARQDVLGAYRQAWVDFPSERPVVVAPGGKPKHRPIVRGRSLTAAWSK